MNKRKIPIESYAGVTIYGEVLKSGKLGRFTVESYMLGDKGNVYHTYAEAEVAMKRLIGVTKP